MQENVHRSASAAQLLDELEAKVVHLPELSREWLAAFADYPGKGHPGGEMRFREWFLLERQSKSLGVAPILAWVPDDLPEDSAWSHLLDNFLGVFQVTGRPVQGELLLEDLWSGQALRWKPTEDAAAPDEHTLVVGRFILGPDGRHENLPGVFSCTAPGLVDAIERDLNAWRAENPRSRLSQFECERLFAPVLASQVPEGEGSPPAGLVRQELDQLLASVPGLAPGGWEDSLARLGPSELLARLAFETSVDLEKARRLIFELAGNAEPGDHRLGALEVQPSAPLGDGDPVEALHRFDLERAGEKSLDESFRQLEKDLGLEEGASQEHEDQESVGPPGPPQFPVLLESYRWDCEATETPLNAEAIDLLEGLGRFLVAVRKPNQATCLQQDQIVAFLLQTGDVAGFRRLRSMLGPFLAWCDREQDEPVAGLHRALEGELGNRLELAVACNHEMAAVAGAAGRAGQARVAVAEPLMVEAENGEQVPVTGIPDRFLAKVRIQDLLSGTWRGGEFEAAAWIPAEAFGEPAPD